MRYYEATWIQAHRFLLKGKIKARIRQIKRKRAVFNWLSSFSFSFASLWRPYTPPKPPPPPPPPRPPSPIPTICSYAGWNTKFIRQRRLAGAGRVRFDNKQVLFISRDNQHYKPQTSEICKEVYTLYSMLTYSLFWTRLRIISLSPHAHDLTSFFCKPVYTALSAYNTVYIFICDFHISILAFHTE